ncbi:macrolide ABC transporter ATP-binding protein [bacterium]|nr:ABC transporter ATP-binding protein [Chloroflexi bacterium CFX6]RIL08798.1 MAG: macrolide ABC transporter ATP-binding protein [bacterium]
MMIELKDITLVYRLGDYEVRALDGVSLGIERGEWVAVMGPSGCGKSSLMNVIGCLDVPTSGSYTLDGVEVTTMGDSALADLRNRRIGFVYQSFNLIARTPAFRQVMLPLQYARNGRRLSMAERERRAREMLVQVGLPDRMHHKPNQLSGGQCQRVAIARALVNGPSILLADEPTGNLDSRSGAEIMDILVRLRQERNLTIIMVTHEEDIAARADRIVRLRDGRIVSGGNR